MFDMILKFVDVVGLEVWVMFCLDVFLELLCMVFLMIGDLDLSVCFVNMLGVVLLVGLVGEVLDNGVYLFWFKFCVCDFK